MLVSKYNIIPNSKTGKYKKADRTMGRMAAILPWYGIQYAALRNVDDIAINDKSLRYVHPGIKTPQFGSLIPKNHASTSSLKDKYLSYMKVFDKVVNPKSTSQELTLLQYLNAMMNSKYLSDQQRVDLLVAIGILKSDGELSYHDDYPDLGPNFEPRKPQSNEPSLNAEDLDSNSSSNSARTLKFTNLPNTSFKLDQYGTLWPDFDFESKKINSNSLVNFLSYPHDKKTDLKGLVISEDQVAHLAKWYPNYKYDKTIPTYKSAEDHDLKPQKIQKPSRSK
ncbi:nucleocapsid protein [Rice Peribunya-like virus 1]|nr:nucleocapsid protein [Rice Peribunya-like virus 1]